VDAGAPVVLEVRGLRAYLHTRWGTVRAVDGVSFSLRAGETLGLVGESGCGKTMTGLSLVRLLPEPAGRIVEGQVLLDGEDLVTKSESEMRRVRGRRVSMILQDPQTSLNPVFTIGDQILEALRLHRTDGGGSLASRAEEALRRVKVAAPEQRMRAYPHQMSGGMKQRVVGAIAVAGEPSVLIADEPTTALDVTIQAQILDLMRALRAELGTAIILITHDLGVIAELADDVIVMYAGKVIERCSVERLFAEPQHPYTIGLLGSIPRLHLERERLDAIEGFVPDAAALPSGCRFHPRCPFAVEKCRQELPPLLEVGKHHQAACWLAPL